jgi:AcrR family transcriptional regulator
MDAPLANRRLAPPFRGIAERIWQSARVEFSTRGYHGARVQGIARGAACNVALMYRHWTSKRSLYLDVLRSVWLASADEISRLVEARSPAADEVVGAYLEAMMRDPMGAQILVREILDGAPFLAELTRDEPELLAPMRRAGDALPSGGGLDPVLALLTVGGVAALVASARGALGPFAGAPVAPDTWRRNVLDLLTNGLGRGNGAAPAMIASGGNGVTH